MSDSTAVAPVKAPKEIKVHSGDESAAFLQMIERASRDASCDVEKMRALVEMRKEFMADQARMNFIAAFSAMMPEMPTIDRRGQITVYSKADRAEAERKGEAGEPWLATRRPQQSTPFATFEDIDEAVTPILAGHGFTLSFSTDPAGDGRLMVTGLLEHKSGHSRSSSISVPLDTSGSKNNLQGAGSSITYGKRYMTIALLKIRSRAPQDQDDDGKRGGAGQGPEFITPDQVITLRKRMEEVGANETAFCTWAEVEDLGNIPAARFGDAMAALDRKAKLAAKQKPADEDPFA